jgi:hypothetical protein
VRTHENGVQIAFVALGFEQLTVGSTVVGPPNLPNVDRTRRIVIQPLGNPLNYRDDGVDPTGSVGLQIPADSFFVFDGDPSKLRLRTDNSAIGTADVRFGYYGT